MGKSIVDIITKGEGLTVEFKRTIDSVFKIAKTIVSLANTSGGNLLIGIGDSGEVLGVPSELHELQKLEKATAELTEPIIPIRVYTEKMDGKTIIRVEVTESFDKPHYAVNEKRERLIYVRVKDKSIPIPRLLIPGQVDTDTEKLLASRHVKSLVTYLRETDTVTARVFSRIINISEKRAERLLNDLTAKQILLKISKGKPELFSLKWTK